MDAKNVTSQIKLLTAHTFHKKKFHWLKSIEQRTRQLTTMNYVNELTVKYVEMGN
jgi:hypothetical protein